MGWQAKRGSNPVNVSGDGSPKSWRLSRTPEVVKMYGTSFEVSAVHQRGRKCTGRGSKCLPYTRRAENVRKEVRGVCRTPEGPKMYGRRVEVPAVHQRWSKCTERGLRCLPYTRRAENVRKESRGVCRTPEGPKMYGSRIEVPAVHQKGRKCTEGERGD